MITIHLILTTFFEDEDLEYDNMFTIGIITKKIKNSLKKVGSWLKGNKKSKSQAKGESAKSMVQFQAKKEIKDKSKSKKAKIIKIGAAVSIGVVLVGLVVWGIKKGKSKGK